MHTPKTYYVYIIGYGEFLLTGEHEDVTEWARNKANWAGCEYYIDPATPAMAKQYASHVVKRVGEALILA
jgi:hypothetical protein